VAANDLCTDVANRAGEKAGKIVDFMLDTERGSVVYAVVAVGSILGVATKLLAVAPEALGYDSGRRQVVLDLDAATLDDAPGFDRDNPPTSADGAIRTRARRAAGERPRRNR
jgi:hypothetical protein